jgi:NAD(P)-dependent dehydrogenase (short-subunit alcohol dehydrogenase family)
MGALMAGVVAGKTAIVTGAGRGIGRGIAILLAKEGARVVVSDIGASLQGEGSDAGPAQETANAIKKAGGEAIASTLSITEPKNAEAIVKMALEAFGRIDILVNNAGILRDVIFHKMSWSDWSDVIAVHLNGSFNMSRAVAPLFREQNSGAFVHMTSTSGLVGNFGQANYMAAKLGIMGLSRGIALDMARFNVRSNCIAPFAFTRMIESIPAQSEQDKRRIEAFQRMTPEKIAPLAVFLCSDAASGITGQILSVRNNEIYLFNQPRPVKTISRAGGWTPQQIAAELNPAFASLFTPLERSEDVFNWDPI